jgi:hypothetical protein
VLGDVGQPQPIGRGGAELAVDQVIVHRRTGLAVQPALLGEHRPDPLLRAQPGDPVLAHPQAAVTQLVGDEPVAERRVVVVDVDRGVDQMRVVPVALAHRVGAPLVEGLRGEAQHPAGHRDGDLLGGEFTDQRVDHFGRTSRAK